MVCLPSNFGDCEDYALAKREALLQAGWSKSHLVWYCYMQSGEGHLCAVG